MVAGLADAAGFEAHDAPDSVGISHIDAGIAVAAGEIALGGGATYFCARGDEGRRTVEANLAIRDIDRFDVECAAAQIGERFVFRLERAIGGDGHVIAGQQGIHGGDVSVQDGVAPMIFEVVDFVADLVAFSAGHGVEREGGAKGEQQNESCCEAAIADGW